MPEKHKVLIVDDDREIVRAMALRLRVAGYDVHTAHDGQQGLDSIETVNPEVVLLDIRMPVMDGLTMLAELRSKDGGRTPVVILSANVAPDIRYQAKELGAYYFLEKPYSHETVVAAIQSALGGGAGESKVAVASPAQDDANE